jgi:TolB-like protein/DNA-binding SARP family transcriptional activator/Flp pilus assembly protein TadD
MFRLRVLGGFALEGAGGSVSPRPQRRGDAVLAVLAVCGDLGCTRERLAALLWPESDEARARHGLRDALHAIRRALGPGVVPCGARLLRLDPAVVVSDVHCFAQALGSGRLADAVQAYGGPLLDGFHVDNALEFERWLDGERARLAREYVEALKHLATAAERIGGWDEAAGWWARAVQHDPLNSHLVFRHVRVLAAIGDRANALKVADAHVRRLREELDVEPDHEILASFEQIRAGEGPPARGGRLPRALGPADPLQAPAESAGSPEPPAAPGSGTPAAAWCPPPSVSERRPHRIRWAAGVAAIAALAGTFGVGPWLKTRAAVAHRPPTAIAVLPFRSLSADSSHAYFAGALHDELLAQLFKVASLRVIGPTSVREYQETSKSLRQIGEELGVGSIVEASVQVVGQRLHVTAQLLDPETQAELWAASYDRTLDDAFAVQSDVARRIVAAVGATLTSVEEVAIAAAPTGNPQAYDFYLEGLAYQRRPGILHQNLESARQLFERALALDSAFAPAHAALSSVHWALYHLRYDRSAAQLELARREADLALRLAPDLPQAHLAVGLARYLVRGDSREALNEFMLGLHGAPSDAELWAWIGRANRDLGDWDSAVSAFDRAQRLDPRDVDLFISIGNTLHYLHRYPDAIAAYRQALALAPDLVEPRLALAWSYVLWRGQLDTLRAVLRGLPLDGDPGGGADGLAEQRLSLLFRERRADSILSLLDVMRAAAGAGERSWPARAHWAARAYMLRGDTAAARAALDMALGPLDSAESASPDDWGVHGERGVVLAELGRRADALREARWLRQSDVYRKDRFRNGWAIGTLAMILMRAGEPDAALAETERLLAGPSVTTVPDLRLNPDWDPIRGNPRFQALLVKYANQGDR